MAYGCYRAKYTVFFIAFSLATTIVLRRWHESKQFQCDDESSTDADAASLLQTAKEPLHSASIDSAPSPASKFISQVHTAEKQPPTTRLAGHIEGAPAADTIGHLNVGRTASRNSSSVPITEATVITGLAAHATLLETGEGSARPRFGQSLDGMLSRASVGATLSEASSDGARVVTAALLDTKVGEQREVGRARNATSIAIIVVVIVCLLVCGCLMLQHDVLGAAGGTRLLGSQKNLEAASDKLPSRRGLKSSPEVPQFGRSPYRPSDRSAPPSATRVPLQPGVPVQLSSTHFPPPKAATPKSATSIVSNAGHYVRQTTPSRSELPQGDHGSSDARYAIPLQDLFELTYLSTGWFNVLSVGGETMVHVEVVVKPHGRVLEVTRVHEPGNSEVLASVGSPAGMGHTPRNTNTSQDGTLPPEILEVCLQEGRVHATIETRGAGEYVIMKDGQKCFTVIGDAVELELSVLSAISSRQAAKMERKGVNFDGNEFLELVISSNWPSASIVLLASVLAIIILRSWPVNESTAQATTGPQFPRLASVVGASATALPSSPDPRKRT